MPRSRVLLFPVAATLIALSVMSSPAMAADPRIAIVQGIPGKVVDICIGSNEVRSRVRYGRWLERTVAPGNRTVRFRQASAGRCRGAVLGRIDLILAADDDITVVGTAKSPMKVVLFDNEPVPVGEVTWFRRRNASDLGGLAVSMSTNPIVNPSAAPPVHQKGQQGGQTFSGAQSTRIWVYQPHRPTPILEESFLLLEGQRHEIIIVGTSRRNARFVFVARPTLD